jgi:hypothetical protein
MNVTNEEAVQSLAQVEQTIAKTRKAVAAAYSSPLLILWGLLLAAAYTATFLYVEYAAVIFWAMAMIGILAGLVVMRHIKRKLPFKEPAGERIGLRIGAMWWSLSLFVFIWLNILVPLNGMQINAFIVTAGMFGYIVLGLWLAAYFMVWLGLAVTAATLAGLFLLTPYYCLWMAVTTGGLIFATGLYLRIRWYNYGPA